MKTTKLFLLLLLFSAPFARAGVDLFSAAVPIADDSPAARSAAMAEALRLVLVKASGQRLGGKGEKLDSLLKEAEDQAQEFRYQTPASSGEGASGRRLWVRFDRRTVEEDLRRLGLILWDRGRPELIPWVAVEEKGRRRLADPERDAGLFQALQEAADRRGLALVTPLMDLEDRNALPTADLWLVHAESVRAASSRYGRALPLVGRLQRRRGGWKGRWSLLLGNGEQRFESQAKELAAVVRKGVDRAADLLVNRFLPSPEGAQHGEVLVRFLGVHDLGDYARLRRLLGALDVVTAFSLERAEEDRLAFRVRVLGGRDLLARQLSLNEELEAVIDIPEEAGAGEGEETLTYELR